MEHTAIDEKPSNPRRSASGEGELVVVAKTLEKMRAEFESLKVEFAYMRGRVANRSEGVSREGKFKDRWIPISSTLIALVGVLSGITAQYWSTHTQLATKRLEVTFQAKLSSYTGLMVAVDSCLAEAKETKVSPADGCTSEIKRAYFTIDPFLNKLDGEKVSADIEEIANTFEIVYGSDRPEERQSLMPHLELLRSRVRKRLQTALFSEIQL